MKSVKTNFRALLALGALVSASAFAQGPRQFEYMGSVTFNALSPLGTQTQNLNVRGNCPSAANPKVRGLQFTVETTSLAGPWGGNGSLTIESARAWFQNANSNPDPIRVGETLRHMGQSRAYDLQGGDRCVDWVSVTARGAGGLGSLTNARVHVWGTRATYEPEEPSYGRGYLLGSTQLPFNGNGKYVDYVNASPTGWVKITVRGNDAQIYDLDLTYGDGSTQSLPIREGQNGLLRNGESTRVINLWNGNSGNQLRTIKQIYVRGRTINAWNHEFGKATVEIYGFKQGPGNGGGNGGGGNGDPYQGMSPKLLTQARFELPRMGGYPGSMRADVMVSDCRNTVVRARAIRLKVEQGTVRLERLVIRFGNGSTQTIQINDTVHGDGTPSSRTSIVDLDGSNPCIESATLFGHTLGGSNPPPPGSPGYNGAYGPSRVALIGFSRN